jgi:hypothetical protein
MIIIFLGAGFSCIAGVPLARQLLDAEPRVDRMTRERLVQRVLANWSKWHEKTGGQPEEYLAELQVAPGRAWHDAVWYVGLVIALHMGRIEYVGGKLTITRHNLDRTTGIPEHEEFWSIIFRRSDDVAVLTTNYDVLAERGLRHRPRPRVPRPGFHYGFGPEDLAGGGYPSYTHIQKISTSGCVPLLKLHGSISWSSKGQELIKYHDCRPAIRGNPAIVAPVTTKTLPAYLKRTWELAAELLAEANTWVIVGYSLPQYDQLVRQLLSSSFRKQNVHVFDPDPVVGERFSFLLQTGALTPHPGLPEGLVDLAGIFDRQSKTHNETNCSFC